MSEKDEALCEVCGRSDCLRAFGVPVDELLLTGCYRLGYEREKAQADTLRLDVAWWRARVEAAERERDEARAFWRSRAEEAWTERDGWKARADAAEEVK